MSTTPVLGMAAILVALGSGCSTTYALRGFDARPVATHDAQARRVAVVVSGVPAQFATWLGPRRIYLDDVRNLYERAAYTALSPRVDFVRIVDAAPTSGFDLVLYAGLAVDARASSGLVCHLQHTLRATDGRGQPLAQATARSVASGTPGVSCASSLAGGFTTVANELLPRALSALAQLEAPPPAPAAMVAPPSTATVAASPSPFRSHRRTK